MSLHPGVSRYRHNIRTVPGEQILAVYESDTFFFGWEIIHFFHFGLSRRKFQTYTEKNPLIFLPPFTHSSGAGSK